MPRRWQTPASLRPPYPRSASTSKPVRKYDSRETALAMGLNLVAARSEEFRNDVIVR